MTLLEFTQQARLDFLDAGPDRHFVCPVYHSSGRSNRGRLCVANRALQTSHGSRSMYELEQLWFRVHGEHMEETNERGYAACVAAYDQLILALTTTHAATPARVEVPA